MRSLTPNEIAELEQCIAKLYALPDGDADISPCSVIEIHVHFQDGKATIQSMTADPSICIPTPDHFLVIDVPNADRNN